MVNGSGFKCCTRCGETKPLIDFNSQRLGLYGRRSRCKPCISDLDRIRNRKERLSNPEKLRARAKNWRVNNPEKLKEIKRLAYLKNADAVKAKSTQWNKENAERRRANQQAWRDNNRILVRDSQSRARAKYRATPKGRLHLSVGSTMRDALKRGTKNRRRTFAILGYSVEALMAHLERLFVPGIIYLTSMPFLSHITTQGDRP